MWPYPKKRDFYKMLSDQAQKVEEGMNALFQFMEDPSEANGKRVEQIENEADELRRVLIVELNQTFVTPIDREDIHSLAVALDDVMDLIEAAAARMALYKIAQPTEEARRLTQVVLSAAQEIVKAVSNLDRMDDVTAHCTEINRLESVADDICRQAIASLFEKGDDPVHVIKWKDIYETLETTTDRCEDVANIVESVAQRTA